MSPFADKPDLWLTAHVQRMALSEYASKIQAVVKGFLVRRRLDKERNAKDLVDNVIQRLLQPKNQSVTSILSNLGLDDLAITLPPAQLCLDNQDLALHRQNLLWHACITLRLTGKGDHIQDLQWADYHERARAVQAQYPPAPPETPVPSLWDRVKKTIWG